MERAITPRTRAILPVYLYGQVAAMDALGDLARARGLAIVADAAQAVGASYAGRPGGRVGRRHHALVLPDQEPGRLRRRRHGADHARRRGRARAAAPRSRRAAPVHARRAGRLQPARRAAGRAAPREAHAPGRVERAPPRDRRGTTTPRSPALPLVLPVERAPARHIYHQYTVRSAKREALAAALAGLGVGTADPLPEHDPRPAPLLAAERGPRLPGGRPRPPRRCCRLPCFPELRIRRWTRWWTRSSGRSPR